METLNVSPPGKEAVQEHPREFSLYAQAGPQDRSVPLEPLQKLAKEYGSSEEKIPEKEASFEALASCLHRKPTHQPAEEGNCLAFAARDTSGHLAPFRFNRSELREDEVRLQIAYCGICHSDLHKVKDEWGGSQFPIVAGHEIVGVVTEVGSAVKGFAVGERAAVGCMVNSCRSCKNCERGLEQYCPGVVYTYDSKNPTDGAITRGGYSTWLTCSQDFVLHLPTSLPMDASAPLLCAGITTYSPMRHFGLDKPGQKIGVVGLGGLGHMAVKLGKAFGCEVTVISTSPNKKEEALERLGADHFLVSKDEEEMAKHAGSLAGIIDTVSAQHDLDPLLSLLDTDGQLVMVGLPPEPLAIRPFSLAQGRKAVAGSGIGGIKETQEMLDFCGEHGVVCDIERIPIDYVNEAMARLAKNDVRYRFVIDIQGTLVQE